jgi:hypothetical protein
MSDSDDEDDDDDDDDNNNIEINMGYPLLFLVNVTFGTTAIPQV